MSISHYYIKRLNLIYDLFKSEAFDEHWFPYIEELTGISRGIPSICFSKESRAIYSF